MSELVKQARIYHQAGASSSQLIGQLADRIEEMERQLAEARSKAEAEFDAKLETLAHEDQQVLNQMTARARGAERMFETERAARLQAEAEAAVLRAALIHTQTGRGLTTFAHNTLATTPGRAKLLLDVVEAALARWRADQERPPDRWWSVERAILMNRENAALAALDTKEPTDA